LYTSNSRLTWGVFKGPTCVLLALLTYLFRKNLHWTTQVGNQLQIFPEDWIV
jgi:hypothetical protein